jgi:hypothetical protein
MKLRAGCRVAVWIWIVLVILVAGAVMSSAQDWRVDDHTRRIAELERVRSDARLSVIENRIDRLESLLYGVVIVAVGQLVLSGLSYRNSSKGQQQ